MNEQIVLWALATVEVAALVVLVWAVRPTRRR